MCFLSISHILELLVVVNLVVVVDVVVVIDLVDSLKFSDFFNHVLDSSHYPYF